ncbi:MAG: hypothetical protein IKT52_05035 [Oscillospiraceae bacterium]|nr:hypothetical protein [Oscillospiraceae bacterium]
MKNQHHAQIANTDYSKNTAPNSNSTRYFALVVALITEFATSHAFFGIWDLRTEEPKNASLSLIMAVSFLTLMTVAILRKPS